MTILRISIFGGMCIAHEQSLVKITRVAQTLLAYLVLERQRVHPREVLASLLWGDQPELRARNCLNTALWRLRSALEPAGVSRGTYLMTTPTGEVGFNRDSNFWLDAAEFETHASAVMMRPVEELHPPDISRLEGVLPLYNGDLLDGFYEDWALRERERVRNLYLGTLAHLMLYYKHHDNFDKSLTYGQQILRLDPLREEIHREVIRLYLANGQRVLAARQYETCCQLLTTELGMPPMEETQALYAQIVPEQPGPSASISLADLPTTLSQALHHLHCTVQQFQEAQKQLRRATELVEQLSRLHYTKP